MAVGRSGARALGRASGECRAVGRFVSLARTGGRRAVGPSGEQLGRPPCGRAVGRPGGQPGGRTSSGRSVGSALGLRRSRGRAVVYTPRWRAGGATECGGWLGAGLRKHDGVWSSGPQSARVRCSVLPRTALQKTLPWPPRDTSEAKSREWLLVERATGMTFPTRAERIGGLDSLRTRAVLIVDADADQEVVEVKACRDADL